MKTECCFCDKPAVAIFESCTVCRDHKSPESFRRILGEILQEVVENFSREVAHLQEEMRIYRDLKEGA